MRSKRATLRALVPPKETCADKEDSSTRAQLCSPSTSPEVIVCLAVAGAKFSENNSLSIEIEISNPPRANSLIAHHVGDAWVEVLAQDVADAVAAVASVKF